MTISFNQFYSLSNETNFQNNDDDDDDNDDKLHNCKYYYLAQLQSIKILRRKASKYSTLIPGRRLEDVLEDENYHDL